jgi:hypothetical protein
MTAISNRSPRVVVEYDARGQRKQKTFDDAYAARRFYIAKLKQGKHPQVKKEN